MSVEPPAEGVLSLPWLTEKQQKVHAAIQRVGGYWRPINATARLLEELGELGEELRSPERGGGNNNLLSGEFADLWIISTCLANQFNISLVEHSAPHDKEYEAPDFVQLAQDAGQIARIINYYDGPKNPKSPDSLPSLASAIATFQTTLRLMANGYGVGLDTAIDAKVAITETRDRERFSVGYDPSTAGSLRAFQGIRESTHCLFKDVARLWGAAAWDGNLPIEYNIERMIPFLTCFTKAARKESLDGFVIHLPDGPDTSEMRALSHYFAQLLLCLAARDPKEDKSLADGDIFSPEWQFSFNGTRLFVSVFSPLYQESHARHSRQGTFVMLQPEASFDEHHVGSKFPASAALKASIREKFNNAGISYPSDLIDAGIEAIIYLLPRWHGDHEVAWWDFLR